MSPKSLLLHIFLLFSLCLWPALTTPALAQDGDMTWQFSEANDPDNKGAMTARLVYGVPETDNVQVMGVCDARPSTGVKFSSMTFGADIGDLANGADAELRFSGGGFEQTLKGNVQRAAEEGLNGVHLDIEHGDKLWTAFAEKDMLDYQVPGYRAAPLKLEPGRDKIKSFIEACRTYEKAVLGDQTTSTAETGDESPELDAFNSAKELGTVAGFEAFLSNYSSGFYADLARAYIDKLNAASKPQAAAPPPPPAAPPAPAVVTTAPGPDPSCRSLSSLRSQGSSANAKLIVINKSGMYRSVMWIDFNGQPKDYGGLNTGDQMTLDTFVGHPWMIADGPGDCIEIVMPHPGTRVVTLTGPGGTVQTAPAPQKKAAPAPAPAPKKAAPKKAAAPKCRSRSVLIDGKCILKSNAPGYCGPGYRVKNGKCVPGAYVPPKRSKPSGHGCPPGQVWSPQELCHYDD